MKELDGLPAVLRLPDEVKLLILQYALTCPNGLHSDRWPGFKGYQVDKVAGINSTISRLIPEALYSCNEVVIKPYAEKVNEYSFTIRYPNIAQSKWVRQLELIINLGLSPNDFRCKESLHETMERQILWLVKLSRGDIGFQRLQTLLIAFPYMSKEHPEYAYNRVLVKFCNILKDYGPLEFVADKLEIFVEPKLYEYQKEVRDNARHELLCLLTLKTRN